MTKLPKPSLATAGLLVLLPMFLVLPTAISSSRLRPSSSSSSSSLRRLDGFGFGGIGDFFDEVFGAGSSDNEDENENEGTTGDINGNGNDNNPWNGALGGLNDALDGIGGLNMNDAMDGIGEVAGDILPGGMNDAPDGIGEIGEVVGDILPGGSENENENEPNLSSDLLGNNNDLLALVPKECLEDGPELDDIVGCVTKPSNFFGCLGLLGSLDPDSIPDPADIEECSDIEVPFCAVVAECEGCGVEIDALMRCIVVNSPGVDGNITDLVETCTLDC